MMRQPTLLETTLIAEAIAKGERWDHACQRASVRFGTFLEWMNDGRSHHPSPACRHLVEAINEAGREHTDRQLDELKKQRITEEL